MHRDRCAIQNNKVRIMVVVLTLLAIMFGLSMCTLNDVRFSIGEENYRESKLKKILNALQNEDTSTIEKLFSKSSIEITGKDEIKEGIKYLFELYKGDMVSYDLKGGSVYESIRDGKRQKNTYIWAIVTTEIDIFDVYCRDIIFDSNNPDNVGISNLAVMRREDVSKYGTPRSDFFGIYRPGQIPEQTEYGFGIEHYYETEYGSFTIPKEFYRNPLKSSEEKYIFFDIINTPDEDIPGAFSIEAGYWGYEVSDIERFTKSIKPALEEKLKTTFPDGNYTLDGTILRNSIEGYPLIRVLAGDGMKNKYRQEFLEAFYFVVGNEKYMEIHMSKYWRDENAFNNMQEIALVIADSFKWAE